LEKTLIDYNVAEDEIDGRNCRYYRSMPRPTVAVAAEDNMVVVVVVEVVKSVEQFEFRERKQLSSRDGICLWRREVLGPYILGR
jgi:hypothetical protein